MFCLFSYRLATLPDAVFHSKSDILGEGGRIGGDIELICVFMFPFLFVYCVKKK